MDGLLLVLALIVWFCAQMKKNKKTKKNASKKNTESNAARISSAHQREERLAQLQAELEKKKNELPFQPHFQPKPIMDMPPVPGEGESLFRNVSMEQADTLEGECICDPDLGHERETIVQPQSVYANEIGKEPVTDFSARGVMQGVIMSEILKRPSQRFIRR